MDYLIIIGGIMINALSAWFFLKIITRLELRINALEKFLAENEPRQNDNNDFEKNIGSNLIDGLKQIKNGDDNHLKLLEMSRKLQGIPNPILTQNSINDEQIDTRGELIPANLSQEEKDILRVWYEKP